MTARLARLAAVLTAAYLVVAAAAAGLFCWAADSAAVLDDDVPAFAPWEVW